MSPPPLTLPLRLGRYAVVRRLGAGGMAEVFLARSRGAEGVDKLLVVKRILPAYAENAHFRAMFIDEARVALKLNHPNVVQVYDFESDGPSLLLIMEHVDGPDLGLLAATAARKGERLPAPLVAWAVRETARGLHYAHERQDEHGHPLEIVHRDVSPGNVLLSYNGAVKLGDFGIARVRSASPEEAGTVKGKFAYMSPEQARGEMVDRRADIYSLGALLTELLAGRPVFQTRNSSQDVLAQVRRGDVPDVRDLLVDVPEALRAVAYRAMRPDRAERYPTARDMALGLSAWLHGLDEAADAAALEQYLARVLPPPSTLPPPPSLAQLAVTVPEAAPASSLLAPTAPVRLVRAATPAATLRERVQVAVIAGRVAPPERSVHTVDTRALYNLLDALAFKSDATLDVADDGGFTLVVGAVRPHVDAALRTARLALDILDAARSLALDPGDTGAAPAVALGLARGVAACSRDAEGTLLSHELVDDALPLAAGLASAARAGEALVAGRLYRIARRAFVLHESPARTPNGGKVWALVRMKTRAERDREADDLPRGLPGREVALRQLGEALDEAVTHSAGRAVLVVAELGMGKSALLGAFTRDAPRRARIVRARGALGALEPPYGLIAQIARDLLGVPDETSADHPRDALADAAEQALDGASFPQPSGRRAALRALRVCLGLEPDEPGGEAATLRELGLALRRVLAAASRPHPVVLLVDNAELADRPSREVLADLARRPPPGGVLVVLTVRDNDPLVRELSSVPVVALGPLDADARRRLIAARLGADDASPELVRAVSAVAGGNPLMLLEVVEVLGDRERVRVRADEKGTVAELLAARDGELPLPATLEEVLAARIEALPPEARALLRWCSILDAELSVDLIDALGGDDGPRVRARLVDDGILVADRRSDALMFAHPALARVVLASIDPTAIPAMHARVADCLERRPEARGAGAGTLARHREAAGARRPAARAWLEAAVALRGQSRERDAFGAYGRVLALCDGAADGEGYALRFAAHLGREDIARATGRTRARRPELLALRAVAAASRDARLVARALARQARYKVEKAPSESVERDVVAAVRAAKRAGEPRSEAEARRVLAVYLGQRGRYTEALHATDEALAALESRAALAAPLGGTTEDGVRAARTLRVEVLLVKGALLRQTGAVEAALKVYADVYALVARHGPRRLLAHVFNNLGVACFARGDYADALRLYLAAVAVECEIGHRDRLGMTLSNAGQACAALGQPERAMAFLKKAIAVSDAVGWHDVGSAGADAHVAVAELLVARGDVEGAAAEMELARASAGTSGSRYALVRVCLGDAAVNLARREYRLARVAAEGADRVAREAGMLVYTLHGRALAAEAAVNMGDRPAARRHVESVLGDPLFASPGRVERGDLVLAACERTLRLLGDVERARALAGMSRRPSRPPLAEGVQR